MTLTDADLAQIAAYLNGGNTPGARGLIEHRSLKGVGLGDGIHLNRPAGVPDGFTVDGVPVQGDVVTFEQATQRPTWEPTPTPVIPPPSPHAFVGVQAVTFVSATANAQFALTWAAGDFDSDGFVVGTLPANLKVPAGLGGYYHLSLQVLLAHGAYLSATSVRMKATMTATGSDIVSYPATVNWSPNAAPPTADDLTCGASYDVHLNAADTVAVAMDIFNADSGARLTGKVLIAILSMTRWPLGYLS